MRVCGCAKEGGAALLELALLLPVFMIMSVGVVHVGYSLREKQILVDASRYGARHAAAYGVPTATAVGIPFKYISCRDVLGGKLSGNEAMEMAEWYACRYIEGARLRPQEFSVSAMTQFEDYAYSLTVRIHRQEQLRLLGSQEYSGKAAAQSTYMLVNGPG